MVLMPREQVLSSLVEYSAFGTLRRLILEVIAFNLTPAQIQDLGKVFRAIDKKQRGTISLEDIKVRGSRGVASLAFVSVCLDKGD